MKNNINLICDTLIDGTGGEPRHNCVITVEDDKIVEIKPKCENELGDSIELHGLTVMPGLIDCHDHLGVDSSDEVAQSKEPYAYTVIKGVKNARKILSAGITTLRDVGERAHIDVCWRRAIQEDLMEGPDLLIAGKFITRTGGHAWFFGTEADGIDNVRIAVREQIKAQVDLIKIMITGGISTPGSVITDSEYSEEEIRVCIEEAHRANRKIAAHVYGGQGATWAIKHGVDSIEHGTFLTEQQLEMMADRGTWLVVNAGAFGEIVKEIDSQGREDLPDYYKEKIKKVFDNALKVLENARKIGVKVAFGGDTVHGRPDLEMSRLVQVGYSPMEAILCGTKAGAELCGISESVGTIEPGKRANIIAVNGDPLSDISVVGDVRFVMKGGKVFLKK